MWDIPEKRRFGHAEDQHPTPHIPQVTPGSLLPREEPSVREELQRKTATPTVHSAHSMQNISKVQKTPAFLTHQSLSIAFRTKFKLLTVGHHFVLCSRLSRHTLLLSASLGHRSCLGPLKPVLSLLAQCSPPPLHGFPGQAVAQCSQLHRESPVQNVFLWKHFPEFQSLFQLIPIFYSCFSLFFCLCSTSELTSTCLLIHREYKLHEHRDLICLVHHCYRSNCMPPPHPNSYVEPVTPNVTVLGDGAFGR